MKSDNHKETVLTVKNMHVASETTPPSIVAEANDGKFVSYFENALGEQLIFVHDYNTHLSILYHGDMGWKPVPIFMGTINVILSNAERVWISACCLVVEEVARVRKDVLSGR